METHALPAPDPYEAVHHTLKTLAHLGRVENLSLQPSLWGEPLALGAEEKLYVRYRMGVDDTEKDRIIHIIKDFLTTNRDLIQQRDLPLLTEFEFRMRQKLALGDDNDITTAVGAIYDRFFQGPTPEELAYRERQNLAAEQALHPERAAAEEPRSPLAGEEELAVVERMEESTTKEIAKPFVRPTDLPEIPELQVSDVSKAKAMTERESEIESAEGEKLGQERPVLEEHERVEPLAMPEEEIRLPPMVEEVAIGSGSVLTAEAIKLEESEIVRADRVIQTSFLLEVPLSPSEAKLCRTAVTHLYAKSAGHETLTDEEWSTLAKGCLVLLRNGQESPEILSWSKEVFLRFFLKTERRTDLPSEFYELYKAVAAKPDAQTEPKTDLSRALRFLMDYSPTAQRDEEAVRRDPNASDEVRALLGAFNDASLDKTLTLEVAPRAHTVEGKPWRSESDKRTDAQILMALASNLATQTNLAERLSEPRIMEDFCLVMAFAMSRRHLVVGKDEADNLRLHQFRKDMKVLVAQMSVLMEAVKLQSGVPHSAEDENRLSNARKLDYLFRTSQFYLRMDAEERGNPERFGRVIRVPASARHEQAMSLWGPNVGMTDHDFDLGLLVQGLNASRAVAKAETARATAGRRTPLGAHFTQRPLDPIVLDATTKSPDKQWSVLFPDGQMASQEDYKQVSSRASARAAQIEEDFKAHIHPPLDFQQVVASFQRGKVPDHFLKAFPDQGVALLRDYVYPYCVLTRRASVDFSSPAAKFVAKAASGPQVASLGGHHPAVQVRVLSSVVRNMASGALKESAIPELQVDMLKKMTSALIKGKPQIIWAETGAGKTFTSKLALAIVPSEAEYVIHVAPFAQAEEGWRKLTSWRDLAAAKAAGVRDLWITAKDLAELLKSEMPKEVHQSLRHSLFFNDEYDSEAYFTTVTTGDEKDHLVQLQDLLYSQFGCTHQVNMSATFNLLEIDNKIARHVHLQEEAMTESARASEGERQALTLLANKHDAAAEKLARRRDGLRRNLEREWSRAITLRPLTEGRETPVDQVERVFADFAKVTIPQEGDRSYLMEFPHVVLSEGNPLVERMQAGIERALPQTSAALLFRDSEGNLRAHVRQQEGSWEVTSLEKFQAGYATMDPKPVVICAYTQDCIGGDFFEFSHETMVKGQFVCYPDISTSHAMYQNMRRMRTPMIGEGVSTVPVMFYLGAKAMSQIEPTAEELSGITPSDAEGAVAKLKQLKLVKLANAANDTLAILGETNRLKMEVVTRKRQLLRAALDEDLNRLGDQVRLAERGTPEEEKYVSQIWGSLVAHVERHLAQLTVTDETNVEEERRRILADVASKVEVAPLDPQYSVDKLLTQRAVQVFVAEMNRYVPEFQKGEKNARDVLSAFLARVYRPNKSPADAPTTFATWKKFFLNHPDLKELKALAVRNPNLADEIVRNILQILRLNPDSRSIDEPLHRPDLPAPTDFVNQTLGVSMGGDLEARNFARQSREKLKGAAAFQASREHYIAHVHRTRVDGTRKLLASLADQLAPGKEVERPILLSIEEMATTDRKMKGSVDDLRYHEQKYQEIRETTQTPLLRRGRVSD